MIKQTFLIILVPDGIAKWINFFQWFLYDKSLQVFHFFSTNIGNIPSLNSMKNRQTSQKINSFAAQKYDSFFQDIVALSLLATIIKGFVYDHCKDVQHL